eukprot:TRINITY_DN1950_c0_g1_i1.p1 TRINITY_DN1950_c0_g1~~TRINITY_DN1950_c0_g1_i1.p1  ORF type:complete len:236 (+),score=15.92 TRINITY_DN1950_c0_g1_i1:536-1243(+)
MSGCVPLTSVDLATHVTSIGVGFLKDTSSLEGIDLSPLRHVEAIGEGFLKNSGVRRVLWTERSAVAEIPDYCFNNCHFLEAIDLKGLSNVTSVGVCFLKNNTYLREIDLGFLAHAESILEDFMRNSSVIKVSWAAPSAVTALPDYFLNNCTALQAIDLTGLANVTCIPEGQHQPKEIDLGPLSSLKTIGSQFMKHSGVTSIRWGRPSRITWVPDNCFLNCQSLESIDLPSLMIAS